MYGKPKYVYYRNINYRNSNRNYILNVNLNVIKQDTVREVMTAEDCNNKQINTIIEYRLTVKQAKLNIVS